jgi:hypothetical protein
MRNVQSRMTPIERKVHLLRAGVSIVALTKGIGYSNRGPVTAVLNGVKRNSRIEAAICLFLGVDRDEFFPPEPKNTVDQAA